MAHGSIPDSGVIELPAAVEPGSSGSLRQAVWLIAMLGAILLMVWRAPPAAAFQWASYLPLHTFVETFAVVVAAMIFGVGWNASSPDRPGNIVLLACTFLAVALLDFAHFMSFAGMPDFVTPSSPQKSINFWLAARFWAAAGLLAAVLLPWRPFASPRPRYLLMAASLVFAGLVYWLGLFHERDLPATFVPGKGLTPFKIGAEYFIILLHLVTAAVLVFRARVPQSYDVHGLLAAVSVMALSELCFTLYSDVADTFNLLGHIYKVVAYLFLYRAVFVDSVHEPYRRLRQSERLIWEEKERAVVTLHSIGDAVIATDAGGRVEYLNPVAEALTGWSGQEARGLSLPQVFTIVAEHTRKPAENPVELCMKENCAVGPANPAVLIHRDGREFAIENSAAPIHDRNGGVAGAVMVFHDISERKQFEQQLAHMAHHDALTGLPNRLLFRDRLDLALAQAHRSKKRLAVMFVDLDRFKTINDTLGHALGDQLLKMAAERLQCCVREGDTIARFGGDEFTVILPNLVQLQDAVVVAQKICDVLAQRFVLQEHEVVVTPSIGIALYPDDDATADGLIKNADTAMYRAKDLGRNTYQFYTADMNARAFEQLAMENSLRRALERHELVLYYQPKVSLESGRITGAEALLRWRHPDLGLVSPAQFIPIAEESGIIVPIGEWALRAACAQNKAWQDAGYPAISMAVNLSARQFREARLLDRISAALEETGLEPRYLELELTESLLMQNAEAPIVVLRELKQMGVQIAIDDFGTGFSSLSYLKRFPIDQLKIDRSFIRDIPFDANDAAIVNAVIALARSLKLEVVAEGVETPEQLGFLRDHGCDALQGFLFSRPLPAEEFVRLLQEGARLELP